METALLIKTRGYVPMLAFNRVHKLNMRQDISVGLKRAGGLLAVMAGVALVAYGGNPKASTICQSCGMDAAKSQTDFILDLDSDVPPMHACSLNCACRLMKKLGGAVTRVMALDYRTRQYVPAKEAFYLKGSKLMPRGSMPPFMLTFGAREDAEAFSKKNDGRILTFDEAVKEMQ